MKVIGTIVAFLAAIALVGSLCFAACEKINRPATPVVRESTLDQTIKSYQDLIKEIHRMHGENIKEAYGSGWASGSNAVTIMLNNNKYDYNKLKLQFYQDSTKFAAMVDRNLKPALK